METKIKTISYWFSVVIVGIVFGFALQFVKAWTEPTQAPPNSNVGAPINTSVTPQIKAGLFTAESLSSPQICLAGDCKTSWPTGASASAIAAALGLRVGPLGCGNIITTSLTCQTNVSRKVCYSDNCATHDRWFNCDGFSETAPNIGVVTCNTTPLGSN